MAYNHRDQAFEMDDLITRRNAEPKATQLRFPGWKSYTMMSVLLFLALGAAVGQHEWYNYLDGRAVNQVPIDQSWAIRVGTALAFLFKASAAAAVGIAFCQGFWFSVRRNAFPVNSLDGMFQVLSNPFKFFNTALILKATSLFILATLVWLLPVTAVLSPGALTVIPRPVTTKSPANVPVVSALDSDVGFVSIGTAGTYLGATQQLRRIAARVLTSGEMITWPSPCGSNCSYTVSFIGPAYQCTDLDSLPSNINLSTPFNNYPSNTNEPFQYLAAGRTVLDSVWGGSLSSQGLWIIRNSVPHNITTQCMLFEASYTVDVEYVVNIPNITTSVVLKDQIPGTAANAYHDARDELSPITPRSWSLMNMFSISEAIGEVLSGYITISSVYGGFHFVDTLIGISNLATPYPFNLAFAPDFPQKIEELLVNTTLSVTYFLNDPPIATIAGDNITAPANYTSVEATVITYPSQYSYSARTLWEIYIPGLFVSFLAVVAGGYMLYKNGVDADMSFSQVVATTRNGTLDQKCYGAGLGGEYIADDFMNLKLKYGLLVEGTVGFGLEDEVNPL